MASKLECEIVADREYQKLAVARKVWTWPEGFAAGYRYRDSEVNALKKRIAELERLISIVYDAQNG